MGAPSGPGAANPLTLGAIYRRFLRYGALAWGGPIAQIALMHRELVERDRWIDEPRFRKTLALYQALPGPEATELAVYFGQVQRGRWGGLLGGLGFVTPGLLLVLATGLLYTTLLTDRAAWDLVLYGARPVVLALILRGIVRLSRATVTSLELGLIAVGAGLVHALVPGANFVLVLLGSGLLALAVHLARHRARPGGDAGALPSGLPLLVVGSLALVLSPGFVWLFAKCGLLTFGGAYTIIPVLQEGAVEQHGYITSQELLDAMAITGALPTPFVSVGSFVGLQAGGVAGFLVATLLVFAPAFAITLLAHGTFERLVHEPRLHVFLLGVTAGVIGLIAAASVPLGRTAFLDAPTVVLFAASWALLQFKHAPVPLVVAGGAVVGVVLQLV